MLSLFLYIKIWKEMNFMELEKVKSEIESKQDIK